MQHRLRKEGFMVKLAASDISSYACTCEHTPYEIPENLVPLKCDASSNSSTLTNSSPLLTNSSPQLCDLQKATKYLQKQEKELRSKTKELKKYLDTLRKRKIEFGRKQNKVSFSDTLKSFMKPDCEVDEADEENDFLFYNPKQLHMCKQDCVSRRDKDTRHECRENVKRKAKKIEKSDADYSKDKKGTNCKNNKNKEYPKKGCMKKSNQDADEIDEGNICTSKQLHIFNQDPTSRREINARHVEKGNIKREEKNGLKSEKTGKNYNKKNRVQLKTTCMKSDHSVEELNEENDTYTSKLLQFFNQDPTSLWDKEYECLKHVGEKSLNKEEKNKIKKTDEDYSKERKGTNFKDKNKESPEKSCTKKPNQDAEERNKKNRLQLKTVSMESDHNLEEVDEENDIYTSKNLQFCNQNECKCGKHVRIKSLMKEEKQLKTSSMTSDNNLEDVDEENDVDEDNESQHVEQKRLKREAKKKIEKTDEDYAANNKESKRNNIEKCYEDYNKRKKVENTDEENRKENNRKNIGKRGENYSIQKKVKKVEEIDEHYGEENTSEQTDEDYDEGTKRKTVETKGDYINEKKIKKSETKCTDYGETKKGTIGNTVAKTDEDYNREKKRNKGKNVENTHDDYSNDYNNLMNGRWMLIKSCTCADVNPSDSKDSVKVVMEGRGMFSAPVKTSVTAHAETQVKTPSKAPVKTSDTPPDEKPVRTPTKGPVKTSDTPPEEKLVRTPTKAPVETSDTPPAEKPVRKPNKPPGEQAATGTTNTCRCDFSSFKKKIENMIYSDTEPADESDTETNQRCPIDTTVAGIGLLLLGACLICIPLLCCIAMCKCCLCLCCTKVF